MRRYIRHPSDIPIVYRVSEVEQEDQFDRLKDFGEGGLCFRANQPLDKGMPIHIEIPLQEPAFEADGRVAWCRHEDDHYAIGIEFQDLYTEYGVRMVEQVCHIEHYRAEVLEKEGRDISSEEAAKEWIDKFAAEFPA